MQPSSNAESCVADEIKNIDDRDVVCGTGFDSGDSILLPCQWPSARFSDSCSKYGRLYDAYTAVGVCPDGWFLPSDDDFQKLERAIGFSAELAGSKGWRGIPEVAKMKTIDFGGTNEMGFNLNGSGIRALDFSYGDLGGYQYLWTATSEGTSDAWVRSWAYNSNNIGRNHYSKKFGFSIRCISEPQ